MNLDRLYPPSPSLTAGLAKLRRRSASRGQSATSVKPHVCKIKKAEIRYVKLLKVLRAHMPALAHWERLVRIGDFIKQVGDAKKSAKEKAEWWNLFGQTRFQKRYNAVKVRRDRLTKKLDAKVKRVLDYYDNYLREDLEKYHPVEERFYVMDHLLSGLALLPFPCMGGKKGQGGWFNDQIWPTMYGQKSPKGWEKVLDWKRLTDLKNAYIGIAAKFAPIIAVKNEALVLKAVDYLFAGKRHNGKLVLNQGKRWKAFTSRINDLFDLNRVGMSTHNLAVSNRKILAMKRIDITDHVYHVPVLNGVFAALDFVATLRAWKRDKKLQDLVGLAASSCGVIEAALGVAALKRATTPASSQRALAAVGATRGAGLRAAAKAVGRVGAVLGFGVAALDANEALLAGDYDAAGFAALGVVGAYLAVSGVATPIGVVVSIVAAIGYALTKDSDMVKFAKTSCYGFHGSHKLSQSRGFVGGSGLGNLPTVSTKPCPNPCKKRDHSRKDEKTMNKLLDALRKAEADKLRKDAGGYYTKAADLHRLAKAEEDKAAKLEKKIHDIPSLQAKGEHGMPPNPDMQRDIARKAEAHERQAKAYKRRAAPFEKTGVALERKAHLLWPAGKK